ncbi:MAG: penicillin-binding protein activator [Magnetococcales bacterium]|nr:penicillin-binding protein activator [Magnetococcales bacterium]
MSSSRSLAILATALLLLQSCATDRPSPAASASKAEAPAVPAPKDGAPGRKATQKSFDDTKPAKSSASSQTAKTPPPAAKPVPPPVLIKPPRVTAQDLPAGPGAALERPVTPEPGAGQEMPVPASPPPAMPQAAPVAPPPLQPGAVPDAQAWQSVLAGYFDPGTAQTALPTPGSLERLAFQPQHRLILTEVLSSLSQEELQSLSKPGRNTSLTPWLHVELGDRLAEAGQEEQARAYWSKAVSAGEGSDPNASIGLAAGEANQRLQAASLVPALKVGLLVPTGGSYATMGRQLILAAQQAVSDYRDVPIAVTIADSGTDAESAARETRQLLEQGVELIVGPVLQASAQGAVPVALAAGKPIMVLNPRAELLNLESRVNQRNIFLHAFQPGLQAQFLARHAVRDRGLRYAAILAPDSDYGHLTSKAFAQEMESRGGKVVHTLFFPPEATDMTPWLKELANLGQKNAAQRLQAASARPGLDPSDPPRPRNPGELGPKVDFDLLFLPMPAETARLVVPQAALFHLRHPQVQFLGTSLWNRPALLSQGSEFFEGALFCDNPVDPVFKTRYSANWKEEAPALAQLTYDSFAVLGQLLRAQRLGGPAWREELMRPAGFRGSSGRVRFLADGTSQHRYQLLQVNGGVIQPLVPTRQ